ncbi:sugar ABC transporter permease [Clostridia bacterium]|nr:sugar ABC transporter permease [Clostridia bacterium]
MHQTAAASARHNGLRRPQTRGRFRKNSELLLLCVPALLYFLVFCYLPMSGVLIAFKDYKYSEGIIGSKWVGLKYFRMFLSSDVTRITVNTVLYGIAFIITGIVSGILTAILLFELRSRAAVKTFQTIMILPYFMSWVIVGLIVYVFLDPMNGAINHLLLNLGMKDVMWYSQVSNWPFIIIFIQCWKNVGYNSVMYYAALMGIDPTLYEAAYIDGAGKFAQFRYITMPELTSLVTILSLIAIGGLFRGDFGLFYQVPMDVGSLYRATDILDTYIYRGLRQGSLSMNTAVGLYQSIMGLIVMLISNAAVGRVNPDNSLF